MEANGFQESRHECHLSFDHESLKEPRDPEKRKGGWITFPFLAVAILGLGLATGGALSNMVVYLIKEYHVPSVDAAQISTIISGSISVAPVAGAIVADALFGCYPIVAISMALSVVSLIMFTLTASIPSLRPAACEPGGAGQGQPCDQASTGQMATLYSAVCLLCLGAAGARFNQATMGANQLDAAADRDAFFSWYFVMLYASSVLGATLIVYVQDAVSWSLGFGVSCAAGAAGLVALLLGARHYRKPAAQGSPFTGIARVLVAAARKRKKVSLAAAASEELKFYYGVRSSSEGDGKVSSGGNHLAPTDSFSFLNRAAAITEGDMGADGVAVRPWRICTVQQVEDLKTVLRILPLWSSAVVLSVAIGVQINFTVLQALVMDRAVGRFTVPAGSMFVGSLVSVVIFLALLDRVLLPLWTRLARGHVPTPLQRVGAGHALTVASMAASALVERGRAATVRAHGEEGDPAWVSPLSAMWLLLPFAVAGAGEALHFPAQVTLYYQEFPPSLKNTATGMMALIVALGFYLSTAVVGVVRRATTWLPDNMNASRLENLYWLLTAMVAVNFGYFLVCAKLYRYQNVGK